MATDAGKPAEPTLFVRRASGLVKGWSSTDGFRYSFFSLNIFLGIWGFLYAVFIPGGSFFWAIIITALFIVLEVFVYAGLIAAMPRAGGDYVWQSRVLHSSAGPAASSPAGLFRRASSGGLVSGGPLPAGLRSGGPVAREPAAVHRRLGPRQR